MDSCRKGQLCPMLGLNKGRCCRKFEEGKETAAAGGICTRGQLCPKLQVDGPRDTLKAGE